MAAIFDKVCDEVTVDDNYDAIRILSTILSHVEETCEKKDDLEELRLLRKRLDDCIGYFRQNDETSPSGEEAAEVIALIEYVKSFVGKIHPPALAILDERSWKGKMPRELHVHGLPHLLNYGAKGWSEPPGRIFMVRGKDYLVDEVKILSEEPLFHLRAVQLLHTEKLQEHVAKQSWCGFPKFQQSNEWLVLNFMIPGVTNVHIVCLFTASKRVREAIRGPSNNSPGSPHPAAAAGSTLATTATTSSSSPKSSSSSVVVAAERTESDLDRDVSAYLDQMEAAEEAAEEEAGTLKKQQLKESSSSSSSPPSPDDDNEDLSSGRMSDDSGCSTSTAPNKNNDNHDSTTQNTHNIRGSSSGEEAAAAAAVGGLAAGGIRPSTVTSTSSSGTDIAWETCLRDFWRADKAHCDERFKLIPNLVDMPWAIKMVVGNKPALTGKKLEQKYYRGKGYMEVDINIASSSIATRILRMVRGACKHVVIDLGVTIQGDSKDELPERVLCQCRFSNVEF